MVFILLKKEKNSLMCWLLFRFSSSGSFYIGILDSTLREKVKREYQKWVTTTLCNMILAEYRSYKYTYIVLHTYYSGHKSCISQDARLYFARLVLQDFSCKTCKTKIYLITLFFWLKLEVFSQKIKLGLTKKFFILSFVTFIQKNTLF